MEFSPYRAIKLLTLVAVSSLLLTGCSASDPSRAVNIHPAQTTQLATNAPEPASARSEPAPATEEAAVEIEEPAITDEERVAQELEDALDFMAETTAQATCLIGTWKEDNATFQASLDAMTALAPHGSGTTIPRMVVVGDSHVQFDGADSYTAWQDDYGYIMESGGSEVEHIQNTRTTAKYYADSEYVWIHGMEFESFDSTTDFGFGSVDIDGAGEDDSATVSFFGTTISGLAVDIENLDGMASYTCSDTELVLHAEGGLSTSFERVLP